MAEANGCELTGTVASLEAVRYTPAGVARQRFWLEHRSRQDEAGGPREVTVRIAVVLAGDALVAQGRGLREGARVHVHGFLARAGYKREARDRIQLMATSLDWLD